MAGSFFQLPLLFVAISTLLLIVLFNWFGHKYRQHQVKKYPGLEHGNLGTIEGALLGLMTLMLAFSYGIVATRYENGRSIIIDEARDIEVAIHRCSLYPDSTRNILRDDFKDYVESRIYYYTAGVDFNEIGSSLKHSERMIGKIRTIVMRYSQNPENSERSLLMVPAVDNVEDMIISGEAVRISRLPQIITWLLLVLALAASFLVGFASSGKRKNLMMVAIFAIMTTGAFYLVIELDRPRQGLVNMDTEVKSIVNLRNMFTEEIDKK
jgi:hypothetical protein